MKPRTKFNTEHRKMSTTILRLDTCSTTCSMVTPRCQGHDCVWATFTLFERPELGGGLESPPTREITAPVRNKLW